MKVVTQTFIVNPSDIHLVLNVFEKDIHKLRIGQHLVAYTNTDTGKKYSCHIVLIGRELSNERNIEVHCHFEQYDNKLVPGMFMTAEIQTTDDSGYTLPADAILNYENKTYAFIEKDTNQYGIVEVKTGTSESGYTEVMMDNSTLLHNANFVTAGAYSLLMKMKNTEEEE